MTVPAIALWALAAAGAAPPSAAEIEPCLACHGTRVVLRVPERR